MSLLNDLARLITGGNQERPAQQQTKVPYNNGFYAGPHRETSPTKIPFNNGFYAGPYQPQRQGMQMNTVGRAEDDAMAMGPQGLVPMNADVAHLNGMTQLESVNPGFTPLQNSYPVRPGVAGQATPQFGAFNSPMQGVNTVNPQLRDNGYFRN